VANRTAKAGARFAKGRRLAALARAASRLPGAAKGPKTSARTRAPWPPRFPRAIPSRIRAGGFGNFDRRSPIPQASIAPEPVPTMSNDDLASLSRHDKLRMAVLIVVLIGVSLWFSSQFLQPAPPRRIVMASGAEFGIYHQFASSRNE
jgi:hypothetical protein